MNWVLVFLIAQTVANLTPIGVCCAIIVTLRRRMR